MSKGNANISVGEIVTAAAQELRDEEFGRLGRPFYVGAAQRGLEEMNFQTEFFKKDFTADIPESRIIELPSDMTAMDQAYLFRGDKCNIEQSTILFIKPNMQSFGGEGYIAQNKGYNLDPMQWSTFYSLFSTNYMYFAGERMGKLYLSPSCLSFEKLFIPYVGLGVDCFGEDFVVPHWCREAITDYVIHRAALALEREDPQFLRNVIARKEGELKGSQGSWIKACMRYKQLDRKGRYDTTAYGFRFGRTP